jgi:hypothetical protein
MSEITGIDFTEIAEILGYDLDSPRYLDDDEFTLSGEELLIQDIRDSLLELQRRYEDREAGDYKVSKEDKKTMNRLRDFTMKHSKLCLTSAMATGDYTIKKGLNSIAVHFVFLKYLSILIEEMWI